jgi:hypothetical protein
LSALVPSDFDGFMSGVNTDGPWIALNAMKGLAATNTLYVIRFNNNLKSRDAKAACFTFSIDNIQSVAALVADSKLC